MNESDPRNIVSRNAITSLSRSNGVEDFSTKWGRFLSVPEDLLYEFPLSIPTFQKECKISREVVYYKVPVDARPLGMHTFTETSSESRYIGSIEIFEKIGRMLASLKRQGYYIDDLTLNSFAVCP
ncbi:MAG: hypothetical protein ACYDBX_00850 [Patescibacteria group bacterium]